MQSPPAGQPSVPILPGANDPDVSRSAGRIAPRFHKPDAESTPACPLQDCQRHHPKEKHEFFGSDSSCVLNPAAPKPLTAPKSQGSIMNIDCCRDQRNARADAEQRCPQENLNQVEVPLGNCLRDGDGFCPFHDWPLLSSDTCRIHAASLRFLTWIKRSSGSCGSGFCKKPR